MGLVKSDADVALNATMPLVAAQTDAVTIDVMPTGNGASNTGPTPPPETCPPHLLPPPAGDFLPTLPIPVGHVVHHTGGAVPTILGYLVVPTPSTPVIMGPTPGAVSNLVDGLVGAIGVICEGVGCAMRDRELVFLY